MPVRELLIKQNDLQPYYYSKAKEYDSDEKKVDMDLTGATIRCTMKSPQGTIKIDRELCVITDSTAGEFEYRWSAGDTDTIGKFFIEFEVTPGIGGKFTLPPDNGAMVRVKSDLDGV